MKKFTLSFLVIAAVTGLYSSFTASQLAAQSLNFSNVIAFTTNVGRLGFFDQGNGRLYIYDGDGKTCLYSGQIKELGKPLEPLQQSALPQNTHRRIRPGTKVMIDEKGEKTVILNNEQP